MEHYTFDKMERHPALTDTATKLQQIVENGKGWAVFYSLHGRGKTYLMASAVNQASLLGKRSRYALMSDILQLLQEAQTGQYEMSFNALFRSIVDLDVLALDEAFEGTFSPWRERTLRQLLVLRSDPVWKPTLFATNRKAVAVAKDFPWLASRFENPDVYEVALHLQGVPDWRKESR